jgi:hypothetical protein
MQQVRPVRGTPFPGRSELRRILYSLDLRTAAGGRLRQAVSALRNFVQILRGLISVPFAGDARAYSREFTGGATYIIFLGDSLKTVNVTAKATWRSFVTSAARCHRVPS